jgi:hypothetical protein
LSVGWLVGWLVGWFIGPSVPILLRPRRARAWFEFLLLIILSGNNLVKIRKKILDLVALAPYNKGLQEVAENHSDTKFVYFRINSN